MKTLLVFPRSAHFFVAVITVLLLLASANFTRSASAMVINEVMYNQPKNDIGYEWVEIYNEGAEAQIVATGTRGWRFYDGTNHVFGALVQGSLTVPPGAFMILSASTAGFLANHAGFSGTLVESSFSMNNTSDTLRLIDVNGMMRDQVSYASSWGASGNGRTLERQIDGSWHESYITGGTPGKMNSVPVSASPSTPPTPPLLAAKVRPVAASSAAVAEMSASPVPAKTGELPFVSRTPALQEDIAVAASAAGPYRSFFSRHATALAVLGAAVGAAGLMRWKRSRKR